MPKTPEQKLEKAADKATVTLRGMLERSIEARAAYDSAIAEGRLLGEALEAARPAITALRASVSRIAALLAEVETAAGPAERASVFAANQDIGEQVSAAMDLLASVPPPEAPEKTTQLLVLKGKLGEWAEVRVPMDPEILGDALRSEEWRGKVSRAVAGTRSRLENIKDRGGAKELEAALDRIEEALKAGEAADQTRRRTNEGEAARGIRRKWVELAYFEKVEAYLGADAEGLGLAAGEVAALSGERKAQGESVLAAWLKRHEGERKAQDAALLGSVYDFSAGQTGLDPETGYAERLRALLEDA